ncbi:AraC family transcriptional regulator [Pedobacter aquatilis]|uniref:helix-turn-helix domain-containing protein n=1 Tax=Pedobacter aquatilis TaxID=351343 RepID=UPI00292D9279|nr:AraC family transcriptional regulator [Pedobacter aquatilis]
MIKRNSRHTFALLNVDRVQLSSQWNYANIISPYNRIYYINSGRGELSDSSGRIVLEKGYLYLIPSFTMCSMACDEHMEQFFVQFFEDSINGVSIFSNIRSILKTDASSLDVELFLRLLHINPHRGINRSFNPLIYEKDEFYKECQQLNAQQNQSVYLETQGIIQQLSSRFLSLVPDKVNGLKHIPDKISEIVSYILTNLHQPLLVSELASMANQHPDYFSRQFKLLTGSRPLNFIIEKRIERAQYLMATSSMNYTEIGTALGFEDRSHFSKTFKKMTGLTPGEYKKQLYSVGFEH